MSKHELYKDTCQLTNGGWKYSNTEWNTIYSWKKGRNFFICVSMGLEIVVLNEGAQVQKHKYERISIHALSENVCWSNSCWKWNVVTRGLAGTESGEVHGNYDPWALITISYEWDIQCASHGRVTIPNKKLNFQKLQGRYFKSLYYQKQINVWGASQSWLKHCIMSTSHHNVSHDIHDQIQFVWFYESVLGDF